MRNKESSPIKIKHRNYQYNNNINTIERVNTHTQTLHEMLVSKTENAHSERTVCCWYVCMCVVCVCVCVCVCMCVCVLIALMYAHI